MNLFIYLVLILYGIFLFSVLYIVGKKDVMKGKIIINVFTNVMCWLIVIIGSFVFLHATLFVKKDLVVAFVAVTFIAASLSFIFIFRQIKQEGEPNEILVKFKEGVSREKIEAINLKYGTEEIKEIPKVLSHIGFYRLKVPCGITPQALVEEYRKELEVEYAEPHYLTHRGKLYQQCLRKYVLSRKKRKKEPSDSPGLF